MIQKQSNNRAICSGDQGVDGRTPHLSHSQRIQENKATILSIRTRMKNWSDSFIQKLFAENKNKFWHRAATEELEHRGLKQPKLQKSDA